MTPAEEKLAKRLARDHREIRVHGAKAQEKLDEQAALKEKRAAWVIRHGLSCFKCGTQFGEWAAGGRNQWGKLWVICTRCVRDRKEDSRE